MRPKVVVTRDLGPKVMPLLHQREDLDVSLQFDSTLISEHTMIWCRWLYGLRIVLLIAIGYSRISLVQLVCW